jgi:hypothetical protein
MANKMHPLADLPWQAGRSSKAMVRVNRSMARRLPRWPSRCRDIDQAAAARRAMERPWGSFTQCNWQYVLHFADIMETNDEEL